MVMMIPHRVLVAPSGFKGSMDADEVAAAIASGIHRVIPGVTVSVVPVPDGGEGTAKLLARTTGGKIVNSKVTGPVGTTIDSHFALLGGEQEGVAVVEMAAAAGLSLVPHAFRDPTLTTTFGVGELIKEAAETEGVHTVLIGCGDSGTSDGGAGALSALGIKVLNTRGEEIPQGGIYLQDAVSIDFSGLSPRLREVRLILALNQHNVLCGPKGVAKVFGPQKGASEEQVQQLDQALNHWGKLLTSTRKRMKPGDTTDFMTGAGTGASGGLGAGLALLGAELTPRFEALIDSGLAGINLEHEIESADIVVTAEGAIDFQTPQGKVPAEIAARSQQAGKPVLALAGSIGKKAYRVYEAGIGAYASIIPLPMELEDALEKGAELLIDSTERSFRLLLLGSALSSSMMYKHATTHNPELRS